MRLIDADALIEVLRDKYISECFLTDAGGVIQLLKDTPTIEDNDLIAGMISDDYVERYIAEYKELNKRINKLNDYISHYKKDIKAIEVYLYEKQLEHMIAYRNVLELRASLDGISLTT
jgi:hypothetical protein